MSTYRPIVTVPKRYFNHIYLDNNHFQHQVQTNSEALHAQECTHMNDIAFLQRPDFGEKN